MGESVAFYFHEFQRNALLGGASAGHNQQLTEVAALIRA